MMALTQGLARRMHQAAKRKMLCRLGMVSDQKFYLDSGMAKPRTDIERIKLHCDSETCWWKHWPQVHRFLLPIARMDHGKS
jgi:hypothetical protein